MRHPFCVSAHPFFSIACVPCFLLLSCKIEQSKSDQQIVFGRHFDASSQLVSKITRESIDLLKANFKDDLSEADWRLVVKLKKVGTQGTEGQSSSSRSDESGCTDNPRACFSLSLLVRCLLLALLSLQVFDIV